MTAPNKIDIPHGHNCPDDAAPLIRLLMQNIGKASVHTSADRKDLGDVLLALGAPWALLEIARHAAESLPAEVWIARGGCGGENVAAFYTHDGYKTASEQVLALFGVDPLDDPLWPIIERVPLVKR